MSLSESPIEECTEENYPTDAAENSEQPNLPEFPNTTEKVRRNADLVYSILKENCTKPNEGPNNPGEIPRFPGHVTMSFYFPEAGEDIKDIWPELDAISVRFHQPTDYIPGIEPDNVHEFFIPDTSFVPLLCQQRGSGQNDRHFLTLIDILKQANCAFRTAISTKCSPDYASYKPVRNYKKRQFD